MNYIETDEHLRARSQPAQPQAKTPLAARSLERASASFLARIHLLTSSPRDLSQLRSTASVRLAHPLSPPPTFLIARKLAIRKLICFADEPASEAKASPPAPHPSLPGSKPGRLAFCFFPASPPRPKIEGLASSVEPAPLKLPAGSTLFYFYCLLLRNPGDRLAFL